MSSNIRIGQTIRLTVRFADFDFSAGTDELLTPTSVVLALFKYNSTSLSYDLVGMLGPVLTESTGVYYYDWTTPEDGKFKLIFTGIVPDATPSSVVDTRIFYVGTATPTIILTGSLQYTFLGELDPLYLDPEAIKNFYPDVDFVEATEIIHRFSLELYDWFGPTFTMTSIMEDYILAATLCELTKVHTFDGGMNGFKDVSDFVLGDLQVSSGKGSNFTQKTINRGNVTTWCELANLLRSELTFSRTNIKAIVRGSNYDNPIPARAIRRFE